MMARAVATWKHAVGWVSRDAGSQCRSTTRRSAACCATMGMGVGISMGMGVGISMGMGVGISMGMGVGVRMGMGMGMGMGTKPYACIRTCYMHMHMHMHMHTNTYACTCACAYHAHTAQKPSGSARTQRAMAGTHPHERSCAMRHRTGSG
jgi:hypothetical protein